jgi:hypothetical protein
MLLFLGHSYGQVLHAVGAFTCAVRIVVHAPHKFVSDHFLTVHAVSLASAADGDEAMQNNASSLRTYISQRATAVLGRTVRSET